MMTMTMRLESRRGSVRAGSWVGARGVREAVVRDAVDGDLDYRLSTLDARRSTLESRILESRHRTVVDSIRFDSFDSFDSFVRSFVSR